jgi:hypothetical protein
MSGAPKNQESASPGSTIVLDVTFRLYSGGPLTDPSPAPTYTIYSPTDSVLATGTGVRGATTGYYTASYAIPLGSTISDLYRISWNAYINDIQVPNAEEYFRVVPAGSADYGDITISDSYLNLIKSVLAYPSTSTVLLTDAQIKSICLAPAMMEYFSKFPRRVVSNNAIYEELILPFPDAYTLGVLDVRVVNKSFLTGSSSSFWDIIRYQSYASQARNYGNSYGIKNFNPNGLKQQLFTERQALKGLENLFSTVKYRVDYENRNLYVYCNENAYADVVWAKWSNDFDTHVKYNYKLDVIKLAQARLLYHLADEASIISDTNLELTVNAEALKTRASELETKVYEKWIQIPSVLIMRMT